MVGERGGGSGGGGGSSGDSALNIGRDVFEEVEETLTLGGSDGSVEEKKRH